MSDFVEESKATEEEDESKTTLASSDVVTKYQEAAKIANAAMALVIDMCVPGAKIVDICSAGDACITEKCDLIYRNKKGPKIDKGIAFPVCVSVNDVVCHYSPLPSDAQVELKENDMVKIDLGCHVDGYIAVCAHTVVVGHASTIAPINDKRADCMLAAYAAAEIACRLIRPGNNNQMVTDAIKEVCEAYGVQPICGTLMHQMKRFVIDGTKCILLREEENQKIEKCEFEMYEVYAIDVAITSGEGKPREMDDRTTVFKRNVDKNYNLKIKASRAFYSDISKKFPTLPFTLRAAEDERTAKLGIRECVQHELLTPYPVLHERAGSYIAHFKYTVLVLPNGNTKITGCASLPEGLYAPSNPESRLPEALAGLMTSDMKKNKKSGKK